MAKLTTPQATIIYDSSTVRKCETDGVFEYYTMVGMLDGNRYYLRSDQDGIAIDEDSTDAEIKTAMIAALILLEKKSAVKVRTDTRIK